MGVGLPEALLLIGVLLAVAASLSGLMRGTVLSISVLALLAGMGLSLAGVISVEAESEGLVELIELALILTLLADGLAVQRELLRSAWRGPLRALALAMPLTLVLIALAAKLLFSELSWAEAFLLGAVLSPTDPVVTSSVVNAPGVPERLRHTLNLESGLNDGLALPFVLFFLALSESGGGALEEGGILLAEAGAGVLLGAAVGFAGGRLLPHLPGGGLAERYEALYALGLGLLTYGVAELTVANGFVAVFVCAIALGATVSELPEAFPRFSESLSAVFEVVTFVAFGALIVATGFVGSVPALVAFIALTLFAARPIAVALSTIGSRASGTERAFLAWFGPKGVASMLFALFVLSSQAPDRSLVFDVAAFVILGSILLHGLTDTVGARWIGRRLSEANERGT